MQSANLILVIYSLLLSYPVHSHNFSASRFFSKVPKKERKPSTVFTQDFNGFLQCGHGSRCAGPYSEVCRCFLYSKIINKKRCDKTTCEILCHSTLGALGPFKKYLGSNHTLSSRLWDHIFRR